VVRRTAPLPDVGPAATYANAVLNVANSFINAPGRQPFNLIGDSPQFGNLGGGVSGGHGLDDTHPVTPRSSAGSAGYPNAIGGKGDSHNSMAFPTTGQLPGGVAYAGQGQGHQHVKDRPHPWMEGTNNSFADQFTVETRHEFSGGRPSRTNYGPKYGEGMTPFQKPTTGVGRTAAEIYSKHPEGE
jgi:hypothetical protein